MIFNPEHIIHSGGLLLIAIMVFAESGLLVGFFLPGDTLLFSAGFFASQGKLPLLPLLIFTVIAAVVGDNVGYYIGKKTGKHIFTKKDGILFKAEYIKDAQVFYEKHGGKTITLARFIPIVRTFAPVVAGVGEMEQKRFMAFNLVGATAWVVGIIMAGHYLGSRIPSIDKYLLPAVGLASLFTFAPAIYHIFKDPKTRAKLWTKLRSKF